MGNRQGGNNKRRGGNSSVTSGSQASLNEPRDPIFTALFDHDPRTSEDLSVKKGEKLEIINKAHEDWWQARSLETHKEGYIPSKYVAECDTPMAEE